MARSTSPLLDDVEISNKSSCAKAIYSPQSTFASHVRRIHIKGREFCVPDLDAQLSNILSIPSMENLRALQMTFKHYPPKRAYWEQLSEGARSVLFAMLAKVQSLEIRNMSFRSQDSFWGFLNATVRLKTLSLSGVHVGHQSKKSLMDQGLVLPISGNSQYLRAILLSDTNSLNRILPSMAELPNLRAITAHSLIGMGKTEVELFSRWITKMAHQLEYLSLPSVISSLDIGRHLAFIYQLSSYHSHFDFQKPPILCDLANYQHSSKSA